MTSFLRSTAFLCVLLLSSAPGVARAEATSIQDFLATKSNWPRLVNTSWTLEGRYGLITKTEIRFAKCSMKFVLGPDVTKPRTTGSVIEVTGRLIQEGDQFVFQVDSMRNRSNDLETTRLKRGELDSQDPEKWYRLAAWVRNRAEFYEDDALRKEAQDLDNNGIQTEFRNIGTRDAQALANLVQKARTLNSDPQLIEAIVHDGVLARLAEARSAAFDDAKYAAILVAISRDLPGSLQPLQRDVSVLADHYRAQRHEVYRGAEEAQRRELNRLLYVEVAAERILHGARADGSNGFDIAAAIAADLPERKDLIEQYQNLAIGYQLARLDVMPRGQMLELAERLDKMGRTEAVREIKEKWLIAREPAMRGDGARGLSELAEQWLALLNDRESAARFFIAATKVSPDYQPAVKWLNDNGYRLFKGEWLPESQVPPKPVSPIDLAIQEGRVEIGMTDAQVRAALGDEPTTLTRIVSLGKVTEFWIYERQGILVHLNRRTRAEPSRVSSVESLSRNSSP
ncbi:hypothetical protein [Planctomicrobium sp. SH664]|uniref:hypothetical protein n=1 Tax=Planctomicrobium sp. SH664 TaxID=3448125 RepID=UPI003F5BD040